MTPRKRSSLLAFSTALYLCSSLADILLTYYLVVIVRSMNGVVFYEVNPFAREFLLNLPLWLWFAFDASGFALFTLVAFAYRRLVVRLAMSEGDPRRRRRLLRISSLWIAVPCMMAGIRLLPVIHNVLVLFGYRTPLPEITTALHRWIGGFG